MADILREFEKRRSLLRGVSAEEAHHRVVGVLKWLLEEPDTRAIAVDLESRGDAKTLLGSESDRAPTASTPEEVAVLGIHFMRQCEHGVELWRVSMEAGVGRMGVGRTIDDAAAEILDRYIEPTLDFIEDRLRAKQSVDLAEPARTGPSCPPAITESLSRFHRDHPQVERNCFIMMRFGKTRLHTQIVEAVRHTLARYGIEGLKADDRQYHDDLFPNVQTYLHGCRFGIAVFERLEQEDFNPNVSLEVGYMRALRKSVCLLKDSTLRTLQTDLVGKLYREFDPQDPRGSIPQVLEAWLRDKDIITM